MRCLSSATGDYNFYVRRGYVLVIANLRGTHASEGSFSHLLLPITRGNRIGTFISGGKLPPLAAP